MFEAARLKVDRANKHINDLEDCLGTFLRTKPYNMRIEVDPKTGENLLRFQSTKNIPDDVPLIIGDAVNNLRSALDLMVAEIYRQAGENDTSARFPFHESRDNLVDTVSKGIEAFAPAIASLIVNQIKPHKGGNDLLWSLNKLNVMDKHRLLIPVIGAVELSGVHLEDSNGNVFEGITLGIDTDGKFFTPISTTGQLQIKNYGQPSISISFPFGSPLQGKPVVGSLSELSQLVTGIVETVDGLYPY